MSLAQSIDENERWILSFYRTSEITGALFFGRLARSMKAGSSIQADMTKHFADESQHAWYWTKCLNDLKLDAIKLESSYQDQYLAAAGMPTNIMEVLAITQVFERRVIGQYGFHRQMEGVHPIVTNTIDTIMNDEKWHIHWVGQALKNMEPEYGKDHIDATIRKFHDADQQVYEKTLDEHGERMQELLRLTKNRKW